jgi:hypothetical protein
MTILFYYFNLKDIYNPHETICLYFFIPLSQKRKDEVAI